MARRTNRAQAGYGSGYRTARVGELIRRVVAEELEDLDDERLSLVSVTGVDVDRDLHRAIVWFTSLADAAENDEEILEALEEHAGRMRREVGDQTRLRKTPKLMFRPDTVVRSAERIEKILDGTLTADADSA